ncbi:MAG: sensor histidine kinase [Pseudomonadota bacterium]
MRLSSKLAVLLTLFSFFSIVLVGYPAFENSRRALEQEAIHHLLSTNKSKEIQINRWIGDLSGNLELLAESPFFVEEFPGEMAAHDPLVPAHRFAHRNIIAKYLKPVLEKSGFSELFILRAEDGRVLVSTDSVQEEKYKTNQPFFEHGKTRTFIQNVYYSMSLQQPVMTVAVPIRDRLGKAIAVLAGRFDLADLSEIMAQRSPMKQTEESYLVNTFNFFVTETRFGKNFALKKSVHTIGVIAGLKGESGVGFYANYRGAPVIGAYHWMPERELCLITEIEQAEAFEPVAALRKFLVMIGALIGLMAALVGWFSARNVIRPLRWLVKETEKIGSGHLEYKIQTAGRDEVGDLSRSFAQMVARLRDTLVSRDRLAAEVAERERIEASLRDKNAEMEHFIYRVSHDLKSPLVTAGAFLEYLKKDIAAQDLERVGKDMSYIRSAVEKMDQLLGELLELSRIGRVVRAPVAISFQNLVGEALSAVAGHIARQKVDVRVGEADVVLHGDAFRLSEIWQNLVENAIKYMGDQPHPSIEIGAERRKGEMAFFVRDNGMGIKPDDQAKIFGLFQKLNSGSEGTGLGLALVKRIVEMYGGRVWVESEGMGQGSCFWFTLPRCEPV